MLSPGVTASLTALLTVLVFVIGQLVQRFFLEPIQDQRKNIGEIAYALVFYANVSDTEDNLLRGLARLEIEEPIVVARTIRKLASELRASLHVILFYRFFSCLRLVPKKEVVSLASVHLVGWSNSIHRGDPDVHRDKIAELLKIRR